MIPQHKFMTLPIASPYVWGAEFRSTPTESWEMGGRDLSDPSGGLIYQMWHGVLEDGTVYLDAPEVPKQPILSVLGMTQMDFSFDQNMKPCVCYTANNHCFFWWYNAVSLSYETLDLGADAITPVVLLDDKREALTSGSDIIVFYLRNGRMYYREQRDRYMIEYDSEISGVRRLLRVGFNKGLRMQLMVVT